MSVQLKTPATNAYSRILGTGSFRPDVVVTNDDICQWIDSSDEWIRQRTGIITRHRADANTSVLDMAEAASRRALEDAGITAEQLDTVIVATVTFPHATPSAASALTERLGATPAPAYDISAACAGYCYAVAQADALVRAGLAQHVLVVGVEKLSDYIDNSERTISFLLGDGAGAVVIGASEVPGISPSVWGSDGSKWNAISMTHSQLALRESVLGSENELLESAVDEPLEEHANPWPTLRQDGQTVFRWAVWEMAKMARKALHEAGIEAEDLAAFIPHQANMRIIDEMVKQLKLPESVVVARDIAENGNTSAASIPMAMDRMRREHPEVSGKLALQIGFGAGLVFGAQVVLLP
ncbi:ketoacyl-ACP synthase III [Arthrobacter sp. MYb211]|uniref:beta-ketoacyl-ACP synthase III n=1 Tax=Micrococcaceae TaxID=1268 RepID=UPI000BB83B74|nr:MULTISPECIES: beta-ketoacyl-ACP synthase III [Micrococcaceae]PCC28270.1 3-oxoacyl-ACP synthase [Glutamicibacter sp. BW80]PRA14012.1 ketoacyl-ACP synthase III [Arthrobacter sp. MYb221]PRC06633.1 ketoacyl-ACP synthase III [Arthrobacter sp. MYb211]